MTFYLLFFFGLIIIYLLWTLIKQWNKVARHETFTALMTALLAYAPCVGVIAYFSHGLFYSALFTLIFWLSVIGYFIYDYSKPRRKGKPKIKFPPLVEEPKTIETKPNVNPSFLRKIFGILFISIEAFEAVVFIVLPPLSWQFYKVGGVYVLTYQNGVLLGFAGLGAFLAVDVARRLTNPKEKILNLFA